MFILQSQYENRKSVTAYAEKKIIFLRFMIFQSLLLHIRNDLSFP